MALAEISARWAAPVWYSNSIPMLQFTRIEVLLENEWKKITTTQDDDQFGLSFIEDSLSCNSTTSDQLSIFRDRELQELPIGIVNDVEVTQNLRGNIDSVFLYIGYKQITLRAGEVTEMEDGFKINWVDNAILIQVDGKLPLAVEQVE